MFKIILNDMYKQMNQYNIRYELDIPNIASTFSNFKDKFYNLEKLNENDKIFFDSSNIVQISPAGYLQPATRWFNSYNRTTILETLQKLIDEYLKFCEMLFCYKQHMQQYESARDFNKIFDETHRYLSKILAGVAVLTKTYSSDETMKEKLDEITKLLTNKIMLSSVL